VVEIVPIVEVPPATPFTLQITLAFAEPVTVALNCRVAAGATVAVTGATLTLTGLAEVILRLTEGLVNAPMPVFVTVMGT
jgi:hypothetical protein